MPEASARKHALLEFNLPEKWCHTRFTRLLWWHYGNTHTKSSLHGNEGPTGTVTYTRAHHNIPEPHGCQVARLVGSAPLSLSLPNWARPHSQQVCYVKQYSTQLEMVIKMGRQWLCLGRHMRYHPKDSCYHSWHLPTVGVSYSYIHMYVHVSSWLL